MQHGMKAFLAALSWTWVERMEGYLGIDSLETSHVRFSNDRFLPIINL